MTKDKKVYFRTAIITYPSNYDGLLSIGRICEKLGDIKSPNTKIVVAREDPDENIKRIHFHCYWDDKIDKNVTPKYFDVKLPERVVVFIKPDKSREYKTYNELASELGIDKDDECHEKIGKYIEEKYGSEDKENIKWDILEYAHPNLETKKVYGDKYFMLRYVVKQKLIARANFDVNEELKYLEKESQALLVKVQELIEDEMLNEIGVTTIDELIRLLKIYKKKKENKEKKNENGKRKRKSKEQEDHEREFCELIRNIFYENPGITKKEVLDMVQNNTNYYFVYASKYLNYNKLINDSFKNKPSCKIHRDYELKFWVPNKLYDYLMWLDDWVRKWTTGRENCERRPKGLILIGASRTGKSSLMALLGDYVYFKNIWSSDNWEYLPAYTIMDDMDAADEGKGLSFSWFKPWFGAQDSITITDKYRPKEDINNGKPLIWLNNFDICETFKSPTAQDYIKRNMVYVNIGNRNLYTKPEGMDIFQYKEFDPKQTWYYKNVINPTNQNTTEEINVQNDDDNDDDENNNHGIIVTTNQKKDLTITLQDEIDQGRPSKRIRIEN